MRCRSVGDCRIEKSAAAGFSYTASDRRTYRKRERKQGGLLEPNKCTSNNDQ